MGSSQRGYATLGADGKKKAVTVCGVLCLILALFTVGTATGIFGAFLYHQYFEQIIGPEATKGSGHGCGGHGGGNDASYSSEGINDGGSDDSGGDGDGDASKYQLVFEDNFDTLDLATWEHELTASGGGNWEFEYYTNNRSNSYVRDGVLYLKPTLTNDTYTAPDFLTSGTLSLWGSVPGDLCTSNMDYGCERTGSATNALNAVQSARLRTAESFAFKHGKVEIRAQLPKGDWLWPAIWMLPKRNYYGQWPASGEIDVVEARGNYELQCTDTDFLDGTSIGIHQMATTLHWGPYYGADPYNRTHANQTLPANGGTPTLFSDDFHNFTMFWDANGFEFYLDEAHEPYLRVNSTQLGGFWKYGEFDQNNPNSFNPWNDTTGNSTIGAPFDQEFFLVMNVAAGGTAGFFPDTCTSNPDGGMASYAKPWSDTSTTAYLDFWNAVDDWYPTWYPFEDNGESAALKIDYIRVYQL